MHRAVTKSPQFLGLVFGLDPIIGNHQYRLWLFYLREGLVTNKLGKANKYSLVHVYYHDKGYYFLPRFGKKIAAIVLKKT
jgi:hypothetical protein